MIDGMVHCFSLDRTQKNSWPFNISTSSAPGVFVEFASDLMVVDIDSDGKGTCFDCIF